MKNKVTLIGGRLDGACAQVEDDKMETTLHEVDTTTNLRTGRHFIYERIKKNADEDRVLQSGGFQTGDRFSFKETLMDGMIVELSDGPLKGGMTNVTEKDTCILLTSMDGTYASYVKKGKKWKFAKAFNTVKEAENFAETYVSSHGANEQKKETKP